MTTEKNILRNYVKVEKIDDNKIMVWKRFDNIEQIENILMYLNFFKEWLNDSLKFTYDSNESDNPARSNNVFTMGINLEILESHIKSYEFLKDIFIANNDKK